MKTLSAVTLKEQLWETLHDIKNGSIDAAKGDAIAAQAREILRTTKVQVQIIDRSKTEMTSELKQFAGVK